MMRSLGTLVIAFFVSAFVAGTVQNQLAVTIGSREEFIAVMILLVLSALVAIAAFGIALAASRNVAGIDWTALALLVLTAAVVIALAAVGSDGGFTIGAQDVAIVAEIIVPTALMIAIQWWFVRRRWLRSHEAT
jgi:hypothetical protein